MEKNGLTYQKRKDLIAVFDRLRTTQGINMNYITRNDIVELLMHQPAPRFYLEPRTIEHLVMRYFKGKKTIMPERTKDLYETFCRVREQHPTAPMANIWVMVSEQPAKSFYLSRRCIRDFIFGWR